MKSHIIEVMLLGGLLADEERWDRDLPCLSPVSLLNLLFSENFLIFGILLEIEITFGAMNVTDFPHFGSIKQRPKAYFSSFLNFQKNIVLLVIGAFDLSAL